MIVWNKRFRNELILEQELLFSDVLFAEDAALTFLTLAMVNKMFFCFKAILKSHRNSVLSISIIRNLISA